MRTTRRIGALWTLAAAALASLGLAHLFARADLWAALTRAAWLHDLGKANAHFQRMVLGRDWRAGARLTQAVRHEVLSVLLLFRSPELDDWLFKGVPPAQAATIRWAATSP